MAVFGGQSDTQYRISTVDRVEERCLLQSMSGYLFSGSILVCPALEVPGQYRARRKEVMARKGIPGPAGVSSQGAGSRSRGSFAVTWH